MLEIRSAADCRHPRRHDRDRHRRAVQQPLGAAAQQRPAETGLLRRAHDQHDRLDVLGEIGQAVRG